MLRLYNTLTRREEDFAPLRDNTVRMYSCGLTVYNRGHIGNFRTFVCLDVLRRTLKYHCGHQMRHVMNFTDVDDRTIAGSQQAGMPLREYTTGSWPRSRKTRGRLASKRLRSGRGQPTRPTSVR
jgi:cysteinyl-tRNA synthetase